MSVSDSSAERPPAAAASVVFTAILLASLIHPYMHPAGAEQLSIHIASPCSQAQDTTFAAVPPAESTEGPWLLQSDSAGAHLCCQG